MRITVLCVILVASAIVACEEGLAGPTVDEARTQTTLYCADCDQISVTRVIDGDTLDTSEGRVRLFGVDAPERGEACYGDATERLRELASDQVRVEAGPRLRDTFGRLLYYVYTEAGASIDETLIAEGLATAWTRDGQHRDFLVSLEEEARSSRTGCLW